jgi:hypothetical protein
MTPSGSDSSEDKETIFDEPHLEMVRDLLKGLLGDFHAAEINARIQAYSGIRVVELLMCDLQGFVTEFMLQATKAHVAAVAAEVKECWGKLAKERAMTDAGESLSTQEDLGEELLGATQAKANTGTKFKRPAAVGATKLQPQICCHL